MWRDTDDILDTIHLYYLINDDLRYADGFARFVQTPGKNIDSNFLGFDGQEATGVFIDIDIHNCIKNSICVCWDRIFYTLVLIDFLSGKFVTVFLTRQSRFINFKKLNLNNYRKVIIQTIFL